MSLEKPTSFAGLAGVSRAAISKAVRSGALVRRPDGKLDTRNAVNSDYLRKHQSLSKTTKSTRSGDSSQSGEGKAGGLQDGSEFEYKNRKLLEEIRFLEAKRKKFEGALVERSLVARLVGKLHSVDSSQLLPLGSLICDEIAGILGINDLERKNKVAGIIDKKVSNALTQSQNIINSFLLDIGAEVIES